jgi:putative heme transporter
MRWPHWIPGSHDASSDAPPAVEDEAAAKLRLRSAELEQLDTVFAPPRWLRDVGLTGWFLVGLFLVLAGLVWLVAATSTISEPLITATVVAVVATPIVSWLKGHRIPRAAGAALVLVAALALGIAMFVLVLAGIKDQSGAVAKAAHEAAAKAQSWLESLGVNSTSATDANDSVSKSVPDLISTFTHGLIRGVQGIASFAFGLSLLFLSIFFLLKDGPAMRASIDRHLGVPETVARTITGGVIRALRGYFKGVTIVAAFNGIVITLGALALGVPLAGTIGLVTFIFAYIPFVGAFVAGAFAVVIALGAKGTTTALIMLVIVILANGLLQNLMQPFAMGSALELNPLVTLVTTIGAGCIFGTVGLILAAPLLSAAVHIMRDLGQARALAALEAQAVAVPSPD